MQNTEVIEVLSLADLRMSVNARTLNRATMPPCDGC